MAKIVGIKGDNVQIETESGKIVDVSSINLNFSPQIGDEIEVFRKDGKIVISKKQISEASGNVGNRVNKPKKPAKKKKTNTKLIITCISIGIFIGVASSNHGGEEKVKEDIVNDEYEKHDLEEDGHYRNEEEFSYLEPEIKEENEIDEEKEASGITGVKVKSKNGVIDDFRYRIEGSTIFLEEYIGEDDCVELEASYVVDGIQYLTDISDFHAGGGYTKLIIDEGFNEVTTGIFNGTRVNEVYFPSSMTNVYDYTLAYMQTGNDEIKIYYAGTQEEWSKIFTRYKRMKVKDAEFGEEWGAGCSR